MGRDCHRLAGDGGAISYSKSKRKANGCMAAFYHLFDFHHFYFSSHHHLTIDSPSSSKGLKIIEESLPSITYKDTQSFKIPPVSMRVRTEIGTTSSRLRALATDTSTSSSEICNSPGSKTPNLVARLMGLDLLPDKTDLNHSLQNLHSMTHHGTSRLSSHRLSNKDTRLGTSSLPESPRMSSARKSDFDIHRLSLQLNKDNKHEEFGCSRLKYMKQDQEENRRPREYARQIVKQIKERVVTRRVVGMDITNSVKNRAAGQSQNSNDLRRDTTVTCSPRTRFSDKENKLRTIHKTNTLQSSFRPEQATQKPKPTTTILVSISKVSGEKQNQKRVKQRELRPINRCKKAESETRFSPRPIKPSPTTDIRIKQREAFLSESTDAKANRCSNPLHKKKFKKIPKSNDLENISATGPPEKQVNAPEGLKSNEDASICISLMHKIDENSPQVARNYKLDNAATVSASSSSITAEEIGRIDSEQDYITRIINLSGINTDPLVSSATMLDPSIFRKLEHSGEKPSGSLALPSNRRLLFDLVGEILIETVELHAKKRRNYHGSELIGEVCAAVARYSRKRCQITGEIVSMDVDDLRETKKLEEEGEEIIAEIERDFIDALVRETASELRQIKTTSQGKLSH